MIEGLDGNFEVRTIASIWCCRLRIAYVWNNSIILDCEFLSDDKVISTHVAVTVEPEVGFLVIWTEKNLISIHGEAFNADTIRTGSRKFKNIIFDIELTIVRLNSEDFSNFLWCLDIIFLTNSYERNDCEVQKMMNFFRIFVNFPHFFVVFYRKTFLCSMMQSRGTHQTIPCEISRRMDSVRSQWGTVEKWFYTKNRPKMWFYGG